MGVCVCVFERRLRLQKKKPGLAQLRYEHNASQPSRSHGGRCTQKSGRRKWREGITNEPATFLSVEIISKKTEILCENWDTEMPKVTNQYWPGSCKHIKMPSTESDQWPINLSTIDSD